MIPILLRVSGFLSYRDVVELDFSTIELACIAGPNGAGKSSLLDAITWALFGQARKRDESLINSHPDVKAAEVTFIFAYEENIYRVVRANSRGKTTQLEFQILQDRQRWSLGMSPVLLDGPGLWKPLTEHNLRETQTRIENVLRLNYETFVNASFFLQGKADQFTQQRPGDRKRILGSILGLEIWDIYRQRVAERRKTTENEISAIDGRLQEIQVELADEAARKTRLKELQTELERLGKTRQLQESAMENIRKIAATLAEQRKLVQTLASQVDTSAGNLRVLEQRFAARQEEKQAYAEVASRAEAIEAAYTAWRQARANLEKMDEEASRFREQEKRRQEPLEEINAGRVRLMQEIESLQMRSDEMTAVQADVPELQAQLETAQQAAAQAEAQLAERTRLDGELTSAVQRQAEARAENPHLKAEMDELKTRIDQLMETEGAVCPLCGQPLAEPDRRRLIEDLNLQGKSLGDRFRTNRSLMDQTDQMVGDLERQISLLGEAEGTLRAQTRLVDQLKARLELIESQKQTWEAEGLPRLAEIERLLRQEDYCHEARDRLAQIDQDLKAIGYDAAAHDALRREEADRRGAESEILTLEKARAAVAPLEREIGDLQAQITSLKQDLRQQEAGYQESAASLAEAEARAPDLQSAEREMLLLQEQENQLRMEVGAAQQKVLVLDDLKARHKTLEARREEQANLSGRYRQLERAFGKDGVPALLIEQALPQIESRSNEILDRLSGGTMSVRFETQAAYKDKRRDDLKETLDILISDSAGLRDYEMFSGGEAFRVNFAIRLALSEVLAQRAGARLQTLVIDEGFGSQDAQGRQRLVEAINLVKKDFSKILVITHIDELKDSFPTRIEVEKTERGSSLRVV